MQKVSWALVGLLVGILIATSVPAGAHHKTSLQRLKNRVWHLEQAFKSNGCSYGENVEWGSSLGNIFGDPSVRCD